MTLHKMKIGQSPTLKVSAGQQFRAAPAMTEWRRRHQVGRKERRIDSIHPFSLVIHRLLHQGKFEKITIRF
jgi:hypothetical protein